MRIENLKFYNFRNLAPGEVSLNKNLNIICGNNGQGKTNLLEAVFLLLRAETFRPSNPISFINLNSKNSLTDSAAIKSKLRLDEIQHECEIHFLSKRKKNFWDKKSITGKSLIQKNPLILFSPESLSYVKDGPAVRRNFLDSYIQQKKDGYYVLAQWKKVLLSRNKLLKALIDKPNQQDLLDSLNSLNKLYFEYAKELTMERFKAIQQLSKNTQKNYKKIFNPEVDVQIEYTSSRANIIEYSEDEIMDMFREQYQRLHSAERAMGSSLVGPHKHEINFLINDQNSRYYSSQGQQRGLILAFKLAEAEFWVQNGSHPIILFDDVMSELDPGRRLNLTKLLMELELQTIITTIEKMTKFSELNESSNFQEKITYFTVENGIITKDISINKQESLKELDNII